MNVIVGIILSGIFIGLPFYWLSTMTSDIDDIRKTLNEINMYLKHMKYDR